ncbi:MAG: hypothetical protein K0R28_3771 [Paenibacillus sp.]|jgi:hypothetical protein|nr:hypothetical protein [Paenibacillus sp.]
MQLIRELAIEAIRIVVIRGCGNSDFPHMGIGVFDFFGQLLQAADERPVILIFLRKTAIAQYRNVFILELILLQTKNEATDPDNQIGFIQNKGGPTLLHVVPNVFHCQAHPVVGNNSRSMPDIKLRKPAPVTGSRANFESNHG